VAVAAGGGNRDRQEQRRRVGGAPGGCPHLKGPHQWPLEGLRLCHFHLASLGLGWGAPIGEPAIYSAWAAIKAS